MESIYRQLQRKINTIGVGLPESRDGYDEEYLKVLFTPEEADFAMKMERGLQTLEEAAQSVDMSVEETRRMLNIMCKDGLVYNVKDKDGVIRYYLVGTYHGFFEWNVRRMEPAWVRPMVKHNLNGLTNVFWASELPFFRYLPIRPDLVENDECLDIDNIHTIIRRQEKIAVVPCFCRATADMFSRKENFCKHNSPPGHELCLAFGEFVDFYLDVLNTGRRITTEEALEIMSRASENGTTAMIVNDKNVEGMCSCCSCCCGVIGGLRAFGPGRANGHVSNYAAQRDDNLCTQCGVCTRRCPTKALSMADEKITFDAGRCMGCGLCVDTCPTKALKLCRLPEDKLNYPPNESYTELLDEVAADRRKTNLL